MTRIGRREPNGQDVFLSYLITVVNRVKIYDNGKLIINVMNPGGPTTRFTSFKMFHLLFGVY